MCGLSISIGKPFAERALSLMHHRGPDAKNIKAFNINDQLIELGHCRLAINDLNSRATQPMCWDNGRFWLVFNGEIYNFQELRTELEKLGCHFTTASDSEVLLAALVTWKESALERIEGMFAFALLDRANGELFLARDPFGIKPLFFTRTSLGIAFASEIPPLLSYPGVRCLANIQKVYDYILFGQTDGDSPTLFADIQSFPPAHIGRIYLNSPRPLKLHLQEYWRPNLQNALSFEEAALNIREIFLDNIKLHLRGDVPLGATLSGGIDSTAIVAGMRAAGGKNLELNTFSFIAPGTDINEEKWIKIAAHAVGAKSHTISINAPEIILDIENLIRLQGEPFGSTSIYAQFKVMQLAHTAGIKIILDGQGADEIFGGYRPFLAARLADFLKQGKIPQAVRFLWHIAKLPGNSIPKIIFQTLDEFLPDQVRLPTRTMLGLSPEPKWLNTKWFYEQGCQLRLASRSSTPRGFLHDRLYDSLTRTVLPALLRFQDRNSMALSIEARVPFLTKKLVEAAYACPSSYLISQEGVTKSVFRAAMHGIIPQPILNRQDKIGFATPEKHWLTILHPWLKNSLGSYCFSSLIPFFDREEFMSYSERVLDGRSSFDPKIWRIINLIKWAEVHNISFL